MTVKSYLILGFTLLLLTVSVQTINNSSFYVNNYKTFPYKEAKKDPFYVFISSISGFRVLIADFLWMDAVQYLGDRENGKEKYKQIYPKTKDIITLDPNFTYPYLAVSGILFFELNEKETAIDLIKYGIEKNPHYGQLRLYLAAYTYSKDDNLEMVAYNIKSVIKEKDHPPMLERILGSIYLKLAKKDAKNSKYWMKEAVKLWADMYEHPTEPLNREYAERQLTRFGFLK
ncbi:MAG: hypothetical protein A2231_04585 [Candidatus Firestonebacteria bacterium RIFOXYA2_FULL_40_8]|nr:MAG: hypothetical protein A2231_04585 [Candidatus Firestonebacteria bacterium RIFOXYA2_FULL_40_8]